jgi:hypothetical protein
MDGCARSGFAQVLMECDVFAGDYGAEDEDYGSAVRSGGKGAIHYGQVRTNNQSINQSINQ